MRHEKRHDSSQSNRSRHYNHHSFHDRQDRRDRVRSRSRHRSRGSQERMNTQSSNTSSISEYLNQQQSNRIQHWIHQNIRPPFSNPQPLLPFLGNSSRDMSERFFISNHQGNCRPQPLLPFLGNSSRDLSQRYFASNYQRSSYLRPQRHGPYATLQENLSDIRNDNLLYVRSQCSSSSSKAQEHSQVIRPQEDPLRIQEQQPQQFENITGASMTRLPFLEVIASLLEVLLHPNGPNWTHQFKFVIQEHILKHFKHKTNNCYQVQVRFCKYNPEISQRDYFPSNLQLRVNGIMCPLPGCSTVPKGPAAPIEITSKCDFHRNDNMIYVRSCEQLVMFVQVTRRLTHEDLLQKLLAKSPVPSAVTMAKIKEKLQEDKANGGDITMTSLHFALLCPISKARIRLPCRAVTCEHLQCFDAACYLKMNERKPKWVCPVCGDPVEYENLQIDEHFKKILEENISSDKILLQADGNWKPFLLQDLSDNILTLDDTLDSSGPAANIANIVTADNICEAQHTTIDLLSEDETSVFDDENANSELGATDWAPSTDSQNDRAVEVVVLSDDDSVGSPACRALQQQLSQSPQKPFEQQQATSTPNASLSLNTPKEDENKTPAPTSTGRKTEDARRTLNNSIGRPPAQMVLRSQARMMKLTSPHKTILLPGLDC